MKNVIILGYNNSGEREILDAFKRYNTDHWIHTNPLENKGDITEISGPPHKGNIRFQLLSQEDFRSKLSSESKINETILYVLDLTQIMLADKEREKEKTNGICGFLQLVDNNSSEFAVIFSRFEKYEDYMKENGGPDSCLKKNHRDLWNVLDKRNIRIIFCKSSSNSVTITENPSLKTIVDWISNRIESTDAYKKAVYRKIAMAITAILLFISLFSKEYYFVYAFLLTEVALLILHFSKKFNKI